MEDESGRGDDSPVRADPSEAADILAALDSVGLKGGRLAACEDQEVGLARQIAEHIGVSPAAWHVDFVRAQIRAAKEMEELDLRASGAYATPSVQRIRDFLAEISKSMNPKRAAKALFGKYRVTTVKRYLGYIQHMRTWMYKMDKKYGPMAGVDVVDYLYAREEEGLGYAVPLAVYQALVWFEKVAGVPEYCRLSDHDFLGMVVKDLVRRLEEKAPPVKRAPRWPGYFVEWLEFIVMDEGFTSTMRLTAWMKLLKFWGAMRFDDAANLKTECLRCFEKKIQGIMKKTKTTGAGKRVRELPIFISEEAHIRDSEWVETGFKLAKLGAGCHREYVFYEGMFYGKEPVDAPVKYQEMVAASSALFRALKDRKGQAIFPDSWERFWTEHSERATLPSAMAAVEVQKVDRDLLGRWCPEGSDQYIRTYNTVIGKMQKKYAEVVRVGKSHQIFDEGGIYEDLKIWMVAHWQVDAEQAGLAVDKWKENLHLKTYEGEQGKREDTPVVDSSSEGELFGGKVDPDLLLGEKQPERGMGFRKKRGLEEVDKEDSERGEHPAPRRMMKQLDEDRLGGYVIVGRRSGRGTLHKLGGESCWMARKRGFKRSETYDECPSPEMYSSRCKLCWTVKKAEESEESTSDSEDEVDLAEDDEI